MDLLRHLRFFVAVAEEGHFGRAAAALGMTQPPVSHGIRRLESRLGVALFERTSRGVALTSVGIELLPRARLLVADGARFGEEARRLGDAGASLRWGMTNASGNKLLLACIDALRATGVHEIATSTASTTTLVEQVKDGSIDIAVIEHPAVADGLECGPVVTQRRWLVVPAEHPAARTATTRSLRGLMCALPPRIDNPPAFDLLIDTINERGLDPEVVTVDGDRALFARVAGGDCFGVTATAPSDLPGVAWISLLSDRIGLRLRIVRRSRAENEKAAHALDRCLLQGRRS